MYIYKPKQPRDLGRQRQSSVYSSASEDNAQTGSSMYDYIDTETKVIWESGIFKIQVRQHLRTLLGTVAHEIKHKNVH